jgi:hypothetical protein
MAFRNFAKFEYHLPAKPCAKEKNALAINVNTASLLLRAYSLSNYKDLKNTF